MKGCDNMNILFESERVYFVNVDMKYIDDYLIMINNPNIQDFVSMKPTIYNYEDEVEWVKSCGYNGENTYSVINKADGNFIGNVSFKIIDDVSAEIGICITPDFQDKHYGTEILKRLVEYGFNDLNFDEICLKVFSHNARAIHCYKKIGFIEYDVIKNVKKSNGIAVDDIHMKIKKMDYFK